MVSFYSSRFTQGGSIDILLSVSDSVRTKKCLENWVLCRLYRLVRSGPRLDALSKSVLSEKEAAELKTVLEEEAVPILEDLSVPSRAKAIATGECWIGGTRRFMPQLEQLIQKQAHSA